MLVFYFVFVVRSLEGWWVVLHTGKAAALNLHVVFFCCIYYREGKEPHAVAFSPGVRALYVGVERLCSIGFRRLE